MDGLGISLVQGGHQAPNTFDAGIAAPAGLAAAPGDGQVVLTWDFYVPPDGDGVEFYVYQSTGTSFAHAHRTGIAPDYDNPVFTVTGLANGVVFYFWVAAHLSTGSTGTPSEAVSATPYVRVYPEAPESFSVSPGDMSAHLHWSAPSAGISVVDYAVYRNGMQIASVEPGASPMSYDDSGLDNNTVYNYNVTAIAGEGEGPSTAVIEVIPQVLPPPDPPASVSASAGDAVVHLSWGSVEAATSYNIYREGSLFTTVASPGWDDTSVSNDTTYTYWITAVNDSGESAASGSASATPTMGGSSPTAMPQGFSLSAMDGSATLDWNAPDSGPPPTAYNIYRDGSMLTQVAALYYTDYGLSNGTTYYYFVTGVNGVGEGPPTDTIGATPESSDSAPATPESFYVTPGIGVVSLSWNSPAGASSYNLYRDGSFVTSITGTSWNDTSVFNGTSYTYYVTAANEWGESAPSTAFSATPYDGGDPEVPDAPDNFAVSADDSAAHLTWTAAPSGLAPYAYNIRRDGVMITQVTDLYYTDTGLSNGTSYEYSVSGVNSSGEGTATTGISVTPVSGIPSPPDGLNASGGDSNVNLSWNSVAGATGYNLYRNGSLATSTLYNSWNDSPLTNGEEYSYYVTAVGPSGESGTSATVYVTPAPGDTGPPPAPEPPSSVMATTDGSTTTLNFTASPTSSVVNYRIEYYLNGSLQPDSLGGSSPPVGGLNYNSGSDNSFVVYAQDSNGTESSGVESNHIS